MEQGAKKLVKSKSGLRMVSVDLDASNPLYISEPSWTPDKECKQCMECSSKFDFMNRRHHCRRCGRCLCDNCCSQKLPLPRMRFVDPERQCGKCAPITRMENDFFDRHLKVLTTGAIVNYCDTECELQVFCRLSTDHSRLEFTSSSPARCPETIALSEIGVFGPQRLNSTDGDKNVKEQSLRISYRNSCNESRSATFSNIITQDSRFQASLSFILAMSKALVLIEDSIKNMDNRHKFEELK